MESMPQADSTDSAGANSAENDLLDFFGCAPPASPPTTDSANVAGPSDTMNADFDPFAALLDLSSTGSVSQAPENKPSDRQCQNPFLDSDLFDFDPFQPAPAMASKMDKADDSLQEEEWLLVDEEEAKGADKEESTTAKDTEEKDEEVKEKEEENRTEKEEAKKESSSPPTIIVDGSDGQKGEVAPMVDVDGEIVQMRRKPTGTNARESSSSVSSESDMRLSRNSSMEVDADIDFTAIQDTEQLDLEVPKHKTSLRRHSSLAKRKRPTRNSIRYSIREGDDESFYMDSTEPRPPVDSSGESGSSKEGSPVANDVSATEPEQSKKPPPGAGRHLLPSGLDLSKIKRRKESSSSPSDDDEPPPLPKEGPPSESDTKTAAAAEEKAKETSASVEAVEPDEKPAAPRKLPPGARSMMPGLQDLNKSKLFGQDRSTKEAAKPAEKKEEKEATQSTPAPRPTLKPVFTPTEKKQEDAAPKPSLKPALKPISKEQKDSQNQSTVEKESATDKPDSVTPSKLTGKKPVLPTKPAANPDPAPAPVLPTLRKVTRQSSKEQAEGGREKSPALELPTLKKVGTPVREGSSERDKEDSDREKTPPAWLSEMKLKKTKPAGGEEKSSREKTPETPAWMKAAQDRKARVADAEKTKENQGKPEETTEEKRPPWLAETSLKKAPKPAPLKESKDQEENKPPVMPRRRPGSIVGKPAEKEPSPPKTEGESYTPSWVNNGQSKKGEDKSGGSSGNTTPTSAGDQMPWMQELAQRRRSRQSESPVKLDAGKESSPAVPEWRREVSLKKRPTVEPKDTKNKYSTEPEWKKEAEEKRKRLMNSGILQQK